MENEKNPEGRAGEVCKNLGPREIRKRLIMGWLILGLGFLDGVAMLLIKAKLFFYLFIAALFFLVFLGIFQARRGVCVVLAGRGLRNLDQGAEQVTNPSENLQLKVVSTKIYWKTALAASLSTSFFLLLSRLFS